MRGDKIMTSKSNDNNIKKNSFKIESDFEEVVKVKSKYFEMSDSKKLELLELLQDFICNERRKIKSK